MSLKLDASMPANIELSGSWVVEWDAVDPTTGASVAGVKVSSASVVGTDVSPTPAGDQPQLGPFTLIPGPQS